MADKPELVVDPERAVGFPQTFIYVRAKDGTKWGPHDIGELDRASLMAWLKGGHEVGLADKVVAILLGHDAVQSDPVFPPVLAQSFREAEDIMAAAETLAREVLGDTTTSPVLNDMANKVLDRGKP